MARKRADLELARRVALPLGVLTRGIAVPAICGARKTYLVLKRCELPYVARQPPTVTIPKATSTRSGSAPLGERRQHRRRWRRDRDVRGAAGREGALAADVALELSWF